MFAIPIGATKPKTNQLLEKHREHLQSWVKNKEDTKAKESGHNRAGEANKKTK